MNNNLDKKFDAVPIVLHQNINNKRNNSNNATIFMSKRHPELANLKINKQAQFILDLCDGDRDLNKIVNIMQDNYKEIDRSILQSDLLDFMFSIWRVGILDWKEYNPFNDMYHDEYKGVKYKILTEEEVVEFIHTNKDRLNYPCLVNKNFIENVTSIRNRIFTGNEALFEMQNGNHKGYISLSYDNDGGYSITMNFYKLDIKLFTVPQILAFIDWSINKYSDLLNKKFTRVDINVLDGDTYISPLDFDFTYVGTMKNAVIRDNEAKNVQVYSKTII